jgi:hypothetical protein
MLPVMPWFAWRSWSGSLVHGLPRSECASNSSDPVQEKLLRVHAKLAGEFLAVDQSSPSQQVAPQKQVSIVKRMVEVESGWTASRILCSPVPLGDFKATASQVEVLRHGRILLRLEHTGRQGVKHETAFLLAAQQPGVTEHRQVVGYVHDRAAQGPSNLAHIPGALTQESDDPQPLGGGEGGQKLSATLGL